jgi:hypothetical protein
LKIKSNVMPVASQHSNRGWRGGETDLRSE